MSDNILGFQHLGLPVTDISRSETFYSQLGFQTVMTTELSDGVKGERAAQVPLRLRDRMRSIRGIIGRGKPTRTKNAKIEK